jgi:hypothetical protein
LIQIAWLLSQLEQLPLFPHSSGFDGGGNGGGVEWRRGEGRMEERRWKNGGGEEEEWRRGGGRMEGGAVEEWNREGERMEEGGGRMEERTGRGKDGREEAWTRRGFGIGALWWKGKGRRRGLEGPIEEGREKRAGWRRGT